MGWTSIQVDGKINVVEEVKNVLNGSSSDNTTKWSVLKASKVGKVVYAAVEVTNTVTGYSKIFAEVVLTSVNNKEACNFSYKEISEECGPCEIDCPITILNMLSETTNEYALEWRKTCYANIEKKKAEKAFELELAQLPIGTEIIMNYWEEGISEVTLEKYKSVSYVHPIWINRKEYYKVKTKTIINQGYRIK